MNLIIVISKSNAANKIFVQKVYYKYLLFLSSQV